MKNDNLLYYTLSGGNTLSRENRNRVVALIVVIALAAGLLVPVVVYLAAML